MCIRSLGIYLIWHSMLLSVNASQAKTKCVKGNGLKKVRFMSGLSFFYISSPNKNSSRNSDNPLQNEKKMPIGAKNVIHISRYKAEINNLKKLRECFHKTDGNVYDFASLFTYFHVHGVYNNTQYKSGLLTFNWTYMYECEYH